MSSTSERPVDFVIITALEEERDAVLAKLGPHRKLDREGADTYFDAEIKTGRTDEAVYRVIVTCLLAMGQTEAALKASAVARRWSPSHVLLVGIAGGVTGKVELGDVMVSREIVDYSVGKVRDGEPREERWRGYPADVALFDAVNSYPTGWETLIGTPRPEAGEPRRETGVIASGGDVIASTEVIAAYRADHPGLIGVEMEGAGVAAALHREDARPRFLMIRGVSDLADSASNAETKQKWRAYACHVAAAYTIGLLQSGPVKPTVHASEASIAPSPQVSTAKLPCTGPDFVGRKRELARLDEQWARRAHVVSLIAWGGVGKSSLVNHWLDALKGKGWDGAQRVYGWSFYDQGTTEQTASSDDFIASALRWFGDRDPDRGSSWDRGARLATLVRERRTLLILDGLEPLQWGFGADEGKIKDQALKALVRELGAQNPGMCLITSRVPVADLAAHRDSCARIDLDCLSASDGAGLLRARGVTGSDEELEQSSKEYGGHCLALALLASYLEEAFEGDIRRRRDAGPLAADERHGAHARRIMRCYESWFEGGLEIAVLSSLGLFDRPASIEEIAAVRALPEVAGLNDGMESVDGSKWKKAVSKLRRARLLASAPDAGDRTPLDAHPLVREHFGEALRREHLEAWRAGHGRLHDHLIGTVKRPLPDTLDEMRPLYRAVRHGCLAGRWRESFHVLKDRIRQGDEHVSLKKLGAVTADLGAFASFFDRDWHRLPAELSLEEWHWLENSGGVLLRAEGRLREGATLMRAAVETACAAGWDDRAAESCRNLASTETAMGNLNDALATIDRAIALADRSEEMLPRVKYRDFRAHLLHRLGQPREAREAFEVVEQMSRACTTEDLRSFPGGGLTALLVEVGEPEAALVRAEAALALTGSGGSDRRSRLSLGLSERGLARALAALGRPKEAYPHFDASIEHVLASGRRDHLAPGLLDRASANLTGDPGSARRDVDEAMILAVSAGFRLIECDAHLVKARLDVDEGRLAGAQASLQRADTLLDDTGYLLREPSLLLVEARYHLAANDRAAAAAKLALARARIEATGLRGLLGELAEVARACADRANP